MSNNMHAESWPEHKEEFEVVLCKKGVSPNAGGTADFRRVRVTAPSSWAAKFHDDMAKETEHQAFAAVKPGIWTQEELLAREREMFQANPPIDRVNI